jgi:hypothetical protein
MEVGRRHGLPVVNPVDAAGRFTTWAVGGRVRQGRRRRDHRGPADARAAALEPHLPAHLPVLLALQAAADLLREAVVVHPHHRRPRPAAGQQRGDRLAPRPHPRGPVRQLAREQRRLGALARPVLGHAAALLALHRRSRDRRGVARRARREGRAGPPRARPAPALRRRRRGPLRRLRGRRPTGARRRGRLVRLGRHALRPVGLPAPGPRGVRPPLPRRLHLRGDRPDPRVVLHPARRVDPAVRRLVVPHRPLPRPHRGRGRPQDVEVGRQHPRPVGPDPLARRGPAAVADARRGQPVGVPTGRSPPPRRRDPPVRAHAVEHPPVLHHVRHDRRLHAARRHPRSRERPASDRWVLAELADLVDTVDHALDRYDVSTATRRLERFVEDLSNWYVRRNRRRFWKAAADDPRTRRPRTTRCTPA